MTVAPEKCNKTQTEDEVIAGSGKYNNLALLNEQTPRLSLQTHIF